MARSSEHARDHGLLAKVLDGAFDGSQMLYMWYGQFDWGAGSL